MEASGGKAELAVERPFSCKGDQDQHELDQKHRILGEGDMLARQILPRLTKDRLLRDTLDKSLVLE